MIRKLILSLALAFGIAGCATFASVSNPVTPQMLNTAENSMIIAFAGLNAYKSACVKKIIPDSCREVVASLQGYTAKVPSLLQSARNLVRQGDSINAITAYNELIRLMTELKSTAQAKGVAVQ